MTEQYRPLGARVGTLWAAHSGEVKWRAHLDTKQRSQPLRVCCTTGVALK